MSKNSTSAEAGAIRQFDDIEREFGANTAKWLGAKADLLKSAFRRAAEFFKGIFGIVVFIALWEACSRFGVIDNIFIPPFSKICVSLWKLAWSGELGYHAHISLWRAMTGLGLGIAVSIPLGLLVG
ncbi:MAG: hypothetical protein LBB28_06080, partial [Synergistaceae bacterium]|nr:hypothetical protein [Synergistaceae bacterium]